jgi:hypothetical protein
MAIVRANFGRLLEPGLTHIFFEQYKRWEPEYPTLVKIATENKRWKVDGVSVTGFGLLAEKPEGQSIAYDSSVEGFYNESKFKTYGLGYVVTQEMMEDERYGVINKMTRALANSVNETVEILVALLYNRAFDTNYIYGDGKALCVTDHPLKVSGGTCANAPTTPSALSVTSLWEGVRIMEETVDDNDKLYRISPTLLIIPPELEQTAIELLESDKTPYTADNQINAIRQRGLKYKVCHYLTDPNAWFLLSPQHELYWYWRRPVTYGQDKEFSSDNALFKATFRGATFVGDWRGIYGNAGT